MVSLETGKTRTESILEVQEAVDLITTYADLMEENDGYRRPLASFVEDERNADHLRPYGVFAVISPFNFPAALSINMASAALIAGNTVVFKPSEETPWTGAILGEIARAAELPAGVFNLVHGGAATGRALVDGGVDGVAFTGSAEVGPGDRPGDAGGAVRPPRAHRDGRQEPGDRDRERRSRQGGRGRGARGLRAVGPEVQRLLARDRGRTRCTTSSWSAWPPSPPAWRSAIPPTRACSSARW